MKKGLVIMAAALFVFALVLPAMAVDVSISGYYRVRGIYQSNAAGGAFTPWDSGNPYGSNYDSPDAWWDHNLEIEPVFKVTDTLKLHTLVEAFGNQIWGSGMTSGGTPSTSSALSIHTFNGSADNIAFRRAYIDWTTTKGNLKVGRMAGNYNYFTAWNNTELDAERIEYTSPVCNGFSLNAFYEKRAENSVTSGNNIADEDIDRYSLVVSYAQPCYYLGAGINYERDRSGSANVTTGWKADRYDYVFCLKASDPTNTYFFEGELMVNDGDYRDYYGTTTDIDRKGWGYYANLGLRKGPLTLGAATAFTSGDDNATDGDYEVGPASGFDFVPLYICYGPYSNILNTVKIAAAEKPGYSNASQFGNPGATATGSQGYLIYADYQVNPVLAVHGALGIGYADKAGSLYQDDEFGKEVNLGLKYQLMSNLAYELHFGYLWVGDFFKGTAANNYSINDIYQVDHSLTLSF